MVEVKYLGRLGNKLFQYCFARILAEGLGYGLKANPIPGFPGTNAPVEGHDYSSGYPVKTIAHDYPQYYSGVYNQTLSWKNKNLHVQDLLSDASKRKIEIRGYFERYEYYKACKDTIRRDWLRVDMPIQYSIHPDDVVMHVRLGDAGEYLGRKLPISYYEEALERAGGRKVFICTDKPADPCLNKFKKYSPIIHHVDPLQDFFFMMSFNKIIQSQSTFSWWASFLSQARQIYAPIPLLGVWSSFHPETDLKVDDESRYVYLHCKSIAMPTWKYLFAAAKREVRKRVTS
ncbi:MAG: alpha-1,2-fucosyltransferase [Gammaproteobacteria bacterium]|nr:alpha-1,2-fucosyltransferase [Gammaproteobacteria bacterium]